MLALRGLGGEDHAPLQEIETRPPVALALDQLEPVDLAFGLAAAPRLGQGSPNRGGVTVQSRGEGGDCRSAASPRFRDPRVEIRGAIPPPGRRPVHTRGADEGGEAARRASDRLGGFVLLDVGHHGKGRTTA